MSEEQKLISILAQNPQTQLRVSDLVKRTSTELATKSDLTILVPAKEMDPDELLARASEIIDNLGLQDSIISLNFLGSYFSAMVCNNALSIGERFTLKDMFLEKLGYPIEFSNK